MTAYIRLLGRARMTVNSFTPCRTLSEWNYQFKTKPTLDMKVDFIVERLKRFKVKGYSREYIKQLLETK